MIMMMMMMIKQGELVDEYHPSLLEERKYLLDSQNKIDYTKYLDKNDKVIPQRSRLRSLDERLDDEKTTDKAKKKKRNSDSDDDDDVYRMTRRDLKRLQNWNSLNDRAYR